GSDEKCEQCLRFGADVAINYKRGPFAPKVLASTQNQGVTVVLDHIGGAYLAENLASLAAEGTLVLIGLMRGARAEIDLAAVLRRHLRIIGSTLRTRPPEEKARIVTGFMNQFGEAVNAGRLKPAIYKTLPLADAAEAQRIMQASEHFGKIVLRVN
ncbi:MAG: zinc-binding dehydrogenase, partial [Terriglobia bacterium]